MEETLALLALSKPTGTVTDVTGTPPIVVTDPTTTPNISFTAPAHVWADSGAAPITLLLGMQTLIKQVTITPNTYTCLRVIATGIAENASTTTVGAFIPSLGYAVAPSVPTESYAGSGNGVQVQKETTEIPGTGQFALTWLITGLTPGTAYNVAVFGFADAVAMSIQPHDVQIDVEETAT